MLNVDSVKKLQVNSFTVLISFAIENAIWIGKGKTLIKNHTFLEFFFQGIGTFTNQIILTLLKVVDILQNTVLYSNKRLGVILIAAKLHTTKIITKKIIDLKTLNFLQFRNTTEITP